MRQEKWLLIGLVLLFSACGNKAKDAPTADGGADAQIGGGGAGGGGGADSGGGRGDALPPGDVPITVRSDGGADAPILISGCSSNLECSGRADNAKICSAPTHECVECLTSSDCAPGVDGSVPGKECVKNVCVSHPACINSIDCVGNFKICDRNAGVCVECVANADCGAADQICAAGACRKRCASDIECTPLRLLCEPKLGYCASCVLDTDCPASQFCSQGECLRDTCVPGTTKCQSNAVVTCNAGGGTWVSPVACKTNQSCQDTGSAGVCMDRVCSPSAKTCSSEGEKVMACSADGLTNAVAEDCAASGKVCVGGACAAVACTAGARFCQGLEVRQCSAKGESSTLVSTCTAAQYCDAATTTCKTKLCNANQPTCSGTLATTCDAVGAAPLPGGTDCAAQGLLCSQGKCQAYVCTASSTYCDAGSIYQCSADGFSSTLVKACATNEYCDKGNCKVQACQPNQPLCSGTNGKVATVCNTDGSAVLPGGTDCSLENKGCSVGLCKDLVCTPSTYFCGEGNAVFLCASTGLFSTKSSTCLTNQYCENGACKTQVCKPSLLACKDSKTAATCNANGSGYEAGDTTCGTSQTCDAGLCKDQVCTPSTYFCKENENAVYYCDAKGLSSSSYTPCTEKQYCDPTSRTCKLQVCAPSQPACTANNMVGTCNAKGSGFETGGVDCAADDQVCSAGACADSAIDTIDPNAATGTSSYTTSATKLNFYTVTSTRTLTQIEQYLSPPSAGATLNWVVFTSATKNGTYTRTIVATNTATTGAKYASSGPISVTLQAGTYYAIGVLWSSSSSTYYYYHASTTTPLSTSFGTMDNGYSTTSSTSSISYTSSTAYVYYPQRLTTEPVVPAAP